MSSPILKGPKWNIPFHIHKNAFEKELGTIIGQQEYKTPFVIYFINKNEYGA